MMNKSQKEVQKYTLDQEKQIIKKLKETYSGARFDCEEKIRELAGRKDADILPSVIYQKKYQEMLDKQLSNILDKLDSGNYEHISDYIKQCYDTGYVGTMYDIMNQGIPITVPINQNQVVKAIQNDTKLSSSLYKGDPLKGTLEENTSHLKETIKGELSRGIASGEPWSKIASSIANGMNNPFDVAYGRSLRIARTEGHRVQQSATYDAQVEAKNAGADVLKQWDSTLDGVTRPTHQALDGQIREIGEPFTNIYGNKAMFPSDFGIAAEDINCRCVCLERARWALGEDELQKLRERAEYFGLDKNDSFEDFKEKYLNLPDDADKIDANNPFGFKSIQGEHDWKSDKEATNPNVNEGKEYQINCQRCVPTWEMRRRGFDVEALPHLGKNEPKGGAYDNWKNIFEGANWEKHLGNTNKQVKKTIIETVQSWGEGSRGEIYCAWKHGSAHVFAVENVGGKVAFIDPQRSERSISEVADYFNYMKPSMTMICRTDNLNPTNLIKQCCKNVGE